MIPPVAMLYGPPLAVTAVSLHNALGSDVAAGQARLCNLQSGLQKGVEPLGDYVLGRTSNTPLSRPAVDGTRVAHVAAPALDALSTEIANLKTRVKGERIALVLGTSTGGIAESETAFAEVRRGGRLPDWYSLTTQHAFDALLTDICERFGISGPRYAVSTACSSSAKAVAAAGRLIHAGFADAALVGGADSLCLTTVLGFWSLGVVDSAVCRPFAADRAGMNVGEGAAFLLLERSAPLAQVSAWLVGAGETSDAHHMAHPHPEGQGAQAAMAMALDAAGLSSQEVGYVNAHGTGTRANDLAEALAVGSLLGKTPLVSSTKWATGHLLGAAGATEAVISVEALRSGRVPGNGPGGSLADLPIRIAAEGSDAKPRYVMTNSLAFGGNNASLVFAHANVLQGSTGAARTNPAISLMSAACWPPERALDQAPHHPDRMPEAKLLPERTRGRASLLVRMYADVLARVAGPTLDLSCVPLVYASAYGEMNTTLELLERSLKSESSPLRFQASVHNAAAGLLSIATHNRSFCTALAAGYCTVAAALLEAYGLLASQDRVDDVVILLAEEAPIDLLTNQRFAPFAAAFHLRRGVDTSALGRLSRPYQSSSSPPPARDPSLPADLAENPIAPALSLVRIATAHTSRNDRFDNGGTSLGESWQIDFQPLHAS